MHIRRGHQKLVILRIYIYLGYKRQLEMAQYPPSSDKNKNEEINFDVKKKHLYDLNNQIFSYFNLILIFKRT